MLGFRHRQHGVGLVEIMIGIVIVGILFAVGAPAYSKWIQSQKVRTGAESILNGIQLARSTAVNSNTTARFNLCDRSTSWQVLSVSPTAAAPDAADTVCSGGLAVAGGNEVRVQERTNLEGTNSVGIFASSGVQTSIFVTDDGSRSITFNSFGRVVANDAAVQAVEGTPNSVSTINVGATGGARSLMIIVRSGGSVKMCDPSSLLAATDPRHC